MTLFDLLFIALFFASVAALLAAVWQAVRGRFQRASRILLRLALAAAVYFAVVVAVSAVLPRRVMRVGEKQCFDDICVALSGFNRTPNSSGIVYRVDVELSSRARRVSQRERDLAVYLTDTHGVRYNPAPVPSAVPFDVLLAPGESVTTTRYFHLPAAASQIGAVVTHEGGFPIGWLIIGYDTWFRKPPIAPLESLNRLHSAAQPDSVSEVAA